MERAKMNTDVIPALIRFQDGYEFESREPNLINSISITKRFYQNGIMSFGGTNSDSCSVSMKAPEPTSYYWRIIAVGKYFDVSFEIDGRLVKFGRFYIQQEPKWTDELTFSGIGVISALMEDVEIEHKPSADFYEETLYSAAYSHKGAAELIEAKTGVTVNIADAALADVREIFVPMTSHDDTFSTKTTTREFLSLLAFAEGANAVESSGEVFLHRGTYPSLVLFNEDDCGDIEIGPSNYIPSKLQLVYQPYNMDMSFGSLNVFGCGYADGDKKTSDFIISREENIRNVEFVLRTESDLAAPTLLESGNGWRGSDVKVLGSRQWSATFVGYHPDLSPGYQINMEKSGEEYSLICDEVTYEWDGGMSISVSATFDSELLAKGKEQEIALASMDLVAEEPSGGQDGVSLQKSVMLGKNEQRSGTGNAIYEIKERIKDVDTVLDENSENPIANKAVAVPIHDILGTNNGNENLAERADGNLTLAGNGNKIEAGAANTVVSGSHNKVGGGANNSLVCGYSNTAESGTLNDTILSGSGNKLTGKFEVHYSRIDGMNNNASGQLYSTHIGGMRNEVKIGWCRSSDISGNDNIVDCGECHDSYIGGAQNEIGGIFNYSACFGQGVKALDRYYSSILSGYKNEVSGYTEGSIVTGSNNVCQCHLVNSIVAGRGNALSDDAGLGFLDGVLLGRYSKDFSHDEYVLVIGNGSDKTKRANMLGLKWDGTLEINETEVPLVPSDVTGDSAVTIEGNTLTVKVPFSTIVHPNVAKGFVASASFFGAVALSSRPPLAVSMNVSYISAITAPVSKGSASLDMSQTITGTPFVNHIDGTLVSVTEKGSFLYEAVFTFEIDNPLGYTYSVNTFQIMRQGGGAVNFSIPSMQEQKAKIQSLTQTIEELTARIEALEQEKGNGETGTE